MSFENFVEQMEELTVLPTLESSEDGYEYPEEYVGKVYRIHNKIVYFESNVMDELQLPLIQAVYESIEGAIAEDVRVAIVDGIDSKLEGITNEVSDIESKIASDMQNFDERLLSVGTPITAAVVRKLISEELENMPKSSSGTQVAPTKKVKLSTLTMLKEEGYSTTEIAELRDADLI